MDLVEFYEQHVGVEAADFRFIALKELLLSRLSGRTVADIGCGTGTMARELSLAGYEVLGMEPDPRLHALAVKVRSSSGVDYKLMNAGIEGMSAGALAPYRNFLLLDVLEHLEDDRAFLQELHARMPGGARLLCLLPALESLYGERDRSVGHFRRYSSHAARRLFSGIPFRTVSFSYWNLLGVPAYWFFESILKKPVPEDFRKGRKTWFQSAMNQALLVWFRAIENRIRPPLGLSLLVQAEK